MSFSIKFEIGPESIRKLELISRIDGNLQILRMNPKWADILEREARIREAVSSIGIEGTVISVEDAKAITVGEKSAQVSEKEEREFVGYYESLRYVMDHVDEKLNLARLLKIHEMVTRGESKASPGKIRREQNAIRSGGRVVYTPPPESQLSFLLSEFIDWFNQVAQDKNTSPVMAGAICHFWFVWIHPFMDGNGRVSRLLTTLLLLKKKCEGIRYFALSDYYNKNKNHYYDTLERVNKCDPSTPSMNFGGDLSLWMKFFIDSYVEQAQSVKEVANRILQLNIRVEHLRADGLITKSHEKVLSFLGSREKSSYNELKKHLGNVSRQRVHQILEPLRKARILMSQKIGKQVWFMLGSPESEPREEILVKKKVNSRKRKIRRKSAVNQGVLPILIQ